MRSSPLDRLLRFVFTVSALAIVAAPAWSQKPPTVRGTLMTQLDASCAGLVGRSFDNYPTLQQTFTRGLDTKTVCACVHQRVEGDAKLSTVLPPGPQYAADDVDLKAAMRYLQIRLFESLMTCMAHDLDSMASTIEAVHASAAFAADDPTASKRVVAVAAVDDGYRIVADYAAKGDLYAYFPVILGAIYGKPASGALVLLPAVFGKTISMRFDELESQIRLLARPTTPESLGAGWTVEPADVQVARVGTFFFDMQKRAIASGGLFLDANTRDPLILVYVDRPCRIKGVAPGEDGDVRHDLVFDRPGLHWLRRQRGASEEWRVDAADRRTAVMLAVLATAQAAPAP